MAITLVRGALLYVNDVALSDHNRSPLSIDVERIETMNRMANGTMRKYVVADKRSFSVSWENLPTITAQTVDGKMGAVDLENFYNTNRGAFVLKVRNKNTSTGAFYDVPYTVMFTDFSKSVVKRWETYELWDVNVTMEEV